MSAVAAGVPITGLAIERTRPQGGEMPVAEAVHGALEGKIPLEEVLSRRICREKE